MCWCCWCFCCCCNWMERCLLLSRCWVWCFSFCFVHTVRCTVWLKTVGACYSVFACRPVRLFGVFSVCFSLSHLFTDFLIPLVYRVLFAIYLFRSDGRFIFFFIWLLFIFSAFILFHKPDNECNLNFQQKTYEQVLKPIEMWKNNCLNFF